MKTIRFNETITRRRHGTEQVFEAGVKYPLPDDVADHYLRRGQATEVSGSAGKAATSTEKADGNTVGSSADVAGKDGGGTGQRAKPVAKPAGAGKVAKKAVKKAGKSR